MKDLSPVTSSFSYDYCWNRIFTIGDGYSPRTGHTVVAYQNSLYVFGGTDRRRRQQDLFRFDIEASRWFPVPTTGPPPPRRSGALGVVHQGRMYIFGGYDGRDGNYFNDLYAFHFASGTWEQLSCKGHLPEARTDHTMVLYQDAIYIFGGYDGHTRYNNIYRFNILTATWDAVPSTGTVPSRRFGHSAVVDESTGVMVVFGGWDGRHTLDDLHVFDFKTCRWAVVDPLGKRPPHRYRHTCVGFGGNMFLFGGVDKSHRRFNDLQRLDLASMTWTELVTCGSVPSSRTFHRAAVLGSVMFMLGGYDGTDRLHDIFSIHIGPLSAPSLLSICTGYVRDNVKEVVDHTKFDAVPKHVVSGLIWQRDRAGVLRGRCLKCPEGVCPCHTPNTLSSSSGSPRGDNNEEENNKEREKRVEKCACSHLPSEHETVEEDELYAREDCDYVLQDPDPDPDPDCTKDKDLFKFRPRLRLLRGVPL